MKAILWRRSLRLYQGWKLAGQAWYSPLAKAISQATSHFDLFSARRVRRPADVFGETPILTTLRLLELTESHLGRQPKMFVDLGCGRGVTCLTAASLGITSVGYEQEASWVKAAIQVAEKLQLAASFQAGDFLAAQWPREATYLVVGTAYPEEMRAEIALRLSTLEPAAVITGDWPLPEETFERLWQGKLPVDWGVATFALWVLR